MAPKQVKVKISKVSPLARLPGYATARSSGMDLHAALAGPVRLRPGERRLIPTGLALEIPPGYEGQVRPRSGLALRHGVSVANAPGTIDADYRGEVGVILINLGPKAFAVKPGDRIAQLVIAPVFRAVLIEKKALGLTRRGSGGFGHTGVGHAPLTPEPSPHGRGKG